MMAGQDDKLKQVVVNEEAHIRLSALARRHRRTLRGQLEYLIEEAFTQNEAELVEAVARPNESATSISPAPAPAAPEPACAPTAN